VVDGSIRFSAGAEIKLSAPKTGDYQGLLIYMPMDNRNRIALNGNLNSRFQGTILAPAADLHINGIASEDGYHSQIIGYYVEVAGMSIINIRYKDEQNYDAFRMPEIRLSE
jgi:hypothetical protein